MADTDAADQTVQGGLTDAEKRDNIIRLAFHSKPEWLDEFCRVVERAAPPGTRVILRGSAVTRQRWRDGAPFDADGVGTSDLDLTLVGVRAVELFEARGFFVPGVHSRPVSEKDPDIAPDLVPLRERLMAMVQRPVNIQASREIVITLRGELLDQPYYTLLQTPDAP